MRLFLVDFKDTLIVCERVRHSFLAQFWNRIGADDNGEEYQEAPGQL